MFLNVLQNINKKVGADDIFLQLDLNSNIYGIMTRPPWYNSATNMFICEML